MGLRFWKRSKAEKPPVPEENAETKVGFQGKELHVNPSDKISLKRLEARLATVKKLLDKKFKHGHPRYDEFMRIKGRLQMQIKLKKGEY